MLMANQPVSAQVSAVPAVMNNMQVIRLAAVFMPETVVLAVQKDLIFLLFLIAIFSRNSAVRLKVLGAAVIWRAKAKMWLIICG